MTGFFPMDSSGGRLGWTSPPSPIVSVLEKFGQMTMRFLRFRSYFVPTYETCIHETHRIQHHVFTTPPSQNNAQTNPSHKHSPGHHYTETYPTTPSP